MTLQIYKTADSRFSVRFPCLFLQNPLDYRNVFFTRQALVMGVEYKGAAVRRVLLLLPSVCNPGITLLPQVCSTLVL